MTATDDAPVLLSYRTLGLGDLLTAVSALRALRDAFPRHRHVLATPGWLAPIVRTIEAVDDHLEVDELRPPPLDGDVEVAVNLHGSGPQSHQVLARVRPRRLIAFHHPDAPDVAASAARWHADEHEVERWCRLLREDGIHADPTRLVLPPPDGSTPDAARGATLIHPGAKSRARRWPPARFAEVARHELSAGRRVVVTGAASEAPLAQEIARAAGLPDHAVLAGVTDIGGLALAVASADHVISGDTGVAHLATAYGTPSLVLFGPTSPDAWGPPPALRDRHRVLWAGRTGDPHADTPDPGLLELTVDDVLTALEQHRRVRA